MRGALNRGPIKIPMRYGCFLVFLFITVLQRGIRKGGSEQEITQQSLNQSLKSKLFPDPPFRIRLWGTVICSFKGCNRFPI